MSGDSFSSRWLLEAPGRARADRGRSARRLRLRSLRSARLVGASLAPASLRADRARPRLELRSRSRSSCCGHLPGEPLSRRCPLDLGRDRFDAADAEDRAGDRRSHRRHSLQALGSRRPGDQRPLRSLVPTPSDPEVRQREAGSRRLQRRPAERRQLAGVRRGHRFPRDARLRGSRGAYEAALPAYLSAAANGLVELARLASGSGRLNGRADVRIGGPVGRVRLFVMDELRAADLYKPTGDQPRAIEEITAGIVAGERYQTLLGATGTGKTATMAWIMEKLQRPALVIAHNKTLAAQLCNEFRELFPANAVEYFVSYYDYFQPEAYMPQADLYIEKDSSRNEDIERLRLSATTSLLSRRDVVVVAPVSCIYGIGSPEEWRDRVLLLERGGHYDRDEALRRLVVSQYVRNDSVLARGRFRVRGDVIEVQPASSETAYRISFFDDEVEQITHFDPLTGEIYARLDNLSIWPASQYVTSTPSIEGAVEAIKREMEAQVAKFEAENRLLEAHRIRQRTEYDMEMMRELGFCNGIENYSRVLEGRPAGSHPFTLLDYFPSDFVCFLVESHQTVPQIDGMYQGDRSRKQTLIDYGFRLPSALDNRPLRFDEFLEKAPQLVFVSATPGAYELRHSTRIAEQLIRPTF